MIVAGHIFSNPRTQKRLSFLGLKNEVWPGLLCLPRGEYEQTADLMSCSVERQCLTQSLSVGLCDSAQLAGSLTQLTLQFSF